MTIRQHFTAVFGLLWIGGCALALLCQTRLMFHLPTTPGWLDGFVLGSTLFGYHFSHRERGYRAAVWLLGGLGGLCFFGLNASTQILALGSVLLWGIYYTKLRRLPVAKPIVVALAWAWVTVWLPTLQLLWPFFLARAAFVFALALAYDLADLDYDRQRHFVTLVSRMGPRRTYALIYTILGMAALCIGWGLWQKGVSPAVAMAIETTYLLTAGLLPRILRSNLPLLWQRAGVDALMMLQAVAVWLVV